ESGDLRLVEIAGGMIAVAAAGDDCANTALVMVRPEDVLVGTGDKPGEGLHGVVVSSRFGGGLHRWQIRLADGQLITVRSIDGLPAETRDVRLSVRPGKARLIAR